MKKAHYIFVREVEQLVSRPEFQVWNSKFGAWSLRFLATVVLLMTVTGCRTAPLPAVNLKEPGWNVREGQAVWKRNKTAQEIAGELLVATRADGSSFVQFTKTPFPMFIARTTAHRWQIEIPMQKKRYSGPGSPPKRLIWAHLPELLAGHPPPKGWSWKTLPDNGWLLENRSSGETLQGWLSSAQE